MSRALDLTGQRFGKLVAVRPTRTTVTNHIRSGKPIDGVVYRYADLDPELKEG